MDPSELEKYFMEQCGAQLREYAAHLLAPQAERALILTAHAVVERLLGEMISTRLRHPEKWLDGAEFRSRTDLASAMGLIGDRELNICRVLNSARNCGRAECHREYVSVYRVEYLR